LIFSKSTRYQTRRGGAAVRPNFILWQLPELATI
jgi:hypothetical protein